MNLILSRVRSFFAAVRTHTRRTWKKYRALKPWIQAVIAAALLGLIVGGIALARSGGAAADTAQQRTVTLATVSSLSGSDTGTSILGTVQSVTEANLLAQTGGTVRSVNTKLGAKVGAGAIIAELDNASEAAAVLQASGAYDAAVAARNITLLQSGNTQTSLSEAQNAARTTYRSSYTALDTALHSNIDTFFGGATAYGPQLLINPAPFEIGQLSRERDQLTGRMNTWRDSLPASDATDPTILLDRATTNTQAISDFLVKLAQDANTNGSGATPAQMAALGAARSTVDGQLAALSAARDAYNAKKTSAAVAGSSNSTSGTQLASADASVKSALGALRGAQAQLEKTRIRATIGGTVNFLSIHAGDYITAYTRVATVAQNGALQIVANVAEDQRNALTVGQKVQIEGGYTGIVTAIAPALDPITKQIEVDIAVEAGSALVNGQSVRITVPSDTTASGTNSAIGTIAASSTDASALLPLSAVKLLPESRIVFTVGTDGRLVAHAVTIGDVVGDRIEITTGITPDMLIVTDARGLSEGQKVTVASDTPAH